MADEETIKTGKSVAKAQTGGAVAAYDYGDDAGAGFENQSSADIAIPFLAILQALSPQVEGEDNPLRPGMLFNTVSEEAYKASEGILFVPGVTKHVVVEWKPKDQGGGIVAVHEVDSEVVEEARKRSTEFGNLKTLGGNELVETFYIYGAQIDEDKESVLGPLVIACSSTKIKRYKAWNSKLNMFAHKKHGMPAKPPLFAHLTRVTSFKDKNPKGDFFNITLAPANGDVASSLLPPTNEGFAAARQVREMVAEGIAQADYKSADKTTGGSADAPQAQGGDPDAAPF